MEKQVKKEERQKTSIYDMIYKNDDGLQDLKSL